MADTEAVTKLTEEVASIEVVEAEDTLIKVVDKDGKEAEIPKRVAEISVYLLTKMKEEDYDASKPIELPASIVTDGNFKEAVAFMEEMVKDPMRKVKMPLASTDMRENVQEWYAEFALKRKREELYALMTVANDMGVAALMTLCSATVAAQMLQMPKEQLYQMFSQMGLTMPQPGSTPLAPYATPQAPALGEEKKKKKKKSGKKKK